MANSLSSQYFCSNEIPTQINENYDYITKSFILFDKHINFTGSRDPTNPAFFLLNQINIYQNGSKEYITHRLTDAQVNYLFYTLENLNTNNSLNKNMYICI